MILSHLIKKLTGASTLAILAAGFFFIHAETASVCSAGEVVTTRINIQNYFNTLLSAINNQPREMASINGNGEATTVAITSDFQNYLNTLLGIFTNNNLPTVPESTSTNTSTNSESIIKKYSTSSTQSLTSIYNMPEHKTELVIPYRLSPLSSDEPLMPQAQPYAVIICLSYNDKNASGCVEKNTPSEASEKLAAMIIQKYLKGIEIRPFRVVMPSAMPPDQQIQLLRQIETQAVSIIGTRMLEELRSSNIFLTETQEGRRQRQNIIIEDAKIAMQEAQKGINWSHNVKDDKSTHNFHNGKAISQLNNILISRWQLEEGK
jgi:hypothetical protein